MMCGSILVFAGTTEARLAIHALLQEGFAITASVATEYGSTLLTNEDANLTILSRRLDARGMETLMRSGEFCAVIDATHPYASDVTANIRHAVGAVSLPYYRLLRDESANFGYTVAATRDSLPLLMEHSGNILLTTGSKDLPIFTELSHYADRIYPRILPFPASLQTSLDLGYKASNIIAMQGPFSQQMNEALMGQFDIRILVTKNSGPSGGYPEKIAAAKTCNVFAITIGHDSEEGYKLSELLQLLKGAVLS